MGSIVCCLTPPESMRPSLGHCTPYPMKRTDFFPLSQQVSFVNSFITKGGIS